MTSEVLAGVVRSVLDRGVLVVSFDTELAWGHAHVRPTPAIDAAGEREVIGAALEVLDRHGITATWAVVGHLFLEACAPEAGRAHPEIVRPGGWDAGAGDGEDWFAVDPGGTAADHPGYYGPDVIGAIASCATAQEIASHSFSHMDAGDARCTDAAFASELDRSREVAAAAGVDLRSFVFPRNSIGHVDLLAPRGFRAFRGPRPAPFASAGTAARRVLRAVDKVVPLSGSAAWPSRRADGLWDIPQTVLFAPAEGRRRHLPVEVWTWGPRRRIAQAARSRSLVHLWLHPSNLADDPARGIDALDRVCRDAARRRDAGRLDVCTMADLVSLLEERLAGAPGAASSPSAPPTGPVS
jgi:peptidoglycan/xylan/chitin deacetylase (PgdA/CDA1 family)